MSLHIANLSPRIRKDELERVFSKFGRCTMQLKDGYGFAVYDFRGDAEEALRILKGRKICGESVYLSWSNKQPKPLQRVERTVRSKDVHYGRNTDRTDDSVSHKSLRSRGEHSISDKKQSDKVRKTDQSIKAHDDRRNNKLKDGGLVHSDPREVVLDEGGHVEVDPYSIDYGRWEDRVDNVHSSTGLNGQVGFDRYEPNRERGDEYKNRGLEGLAGHQSVGTSSEKNIKVYPDTKRGQQTCFKCGAAGHKMRDCPEKSTCRSDHRNAAKSRSEVGRAESESRSGGRLHSIGKNSRSSEKDRRVHSDIKKSHQTCFKCGVAGHKMRDCPLDENIREQSTRRSEQRHGTIGTSEVRRENPESKDGGLLQSSTRNSRSARQLDTDRKTSYPAKDGVSRRCSPVKYESGKDTTKDYNRKRHREMDDDFVETHDDKKSRVSHLHSDYTSTDLGTHSKFVKPSVALSPHSRSRSPIQHSVSISSRSPSLKMKSRSRSRSRSKSLTSSSSISIGRFSPSSPKKAEKNLNGVSKGAPSPLSKEVLTEVREHLEPEEMEKSPTTADRVEKSLSGDTDNPKSCQLMEDLTKSKQTEHDSETLNSTMHAEVSLNGFVHDGKSSQYHEAVPEKSQPKELDTLPNSELPQTDALLLSEDVSYSDKGIDDMELDQLHNDVCSSPTVPHVSSEVKATCSSLLEKDDEASAAVNMTTKKLQEFEELENTNALEIATTPEPVNLSDLKAPSKLHVGSQLSISAEELSRVLKHYGLEHPEENERHLDAEDYFGSSRLWPWEMIYYRRLKKGPISVENYARRVAQNKAFSITDKYIRSSSGWGEGEFIEDHC